MPRSTAGYTLPHLRLTHVMQDSHAWHVLTHTERSLWLSMRRKLMSFNNGNIEATAKVLSHDGFTSSTTIAKSLRALIAVGLIAKTRQGRLTFGGKECSLFRFTDEPCLDIPKLGIAAMKATHEWKAWKSRAETIAAIRSAHDAARNPDHRNAKKSRTARASKVQQMDRSASANGPETPFSGPANGPCLATPVQFLDHAKAHPIGREPAPVLDIALSRAAEVPPRAMVQQMNTYCTTATPVAAGARRMAAVLRCVRPSPSQRPAGYRAARARLPFNAPPFN